MVDPTVVTAGTATGANMATTAPGSRGTMAERFAAAATVLGSSLLIGMAALVVAVTVTLVLGGQVAELHGLVLPLATMTVIMLATRGPFRDRIGNWSCPLNLAGLGIIVFAIWQAIGHYDIGSDSQTDHLEAVLHLANGWNPFHDPRFSKILDVTPADYVMRNYPYNDYVVHIAVKGNYFMGGALYKLTGAVESAKAINMIAFTAAFLLAFAAAIVNRLSMPWALALAAAAALNPVAITQFWVFYMDGFSASLMTALLALGFILPHESGRILRMAFISAVVVLVGSKLTSMVYGAILGAAVVAYLRHRSGRFLGLKEYVIGGLIGVVLVGYDPIVVNTVKHGDPFYYFKKEAAQYKSEADFIWNGGERFVDNHDRLSRFVLSLAAESACNPTVLTYKLPFTLTSTDVMNYRMLHPDTRIGGFGPLTSGAALLTLVALTATLIRRPRHRNAMLFFFMAVLASTLVNPHAWWARYAPQFPLAMLAVGAFGLFLPWRDWLGALSRLIILVVLANGVLVGGIHLYYQSIGQEALHTELRVLRQLGRPVTVALDNWRSVRQRFKDNGIPIAQEVSYAKCAPAIWIFRSGASVCLPTPFDPETAAAVQTLQAVDKKMSAEKLNELLLLRRF